MEVKGKGKTGQRYEEDGKGEQDRGTEETKKNAGYGMENFEEGSIITK